MIRPDYLYESVGRIQGGAKFRQHATHLSPHVQLRLILPLSLKIPCALCLAILIGCTASRPVRIPVPDDYEMTSGPYHIRLKNGEGHKAGRIRISNDSAFFGDRAVPLAAIRSIETRSISLPKTAGLVAATGGVAVALAAIYVAFFVVPEKLIY